MFKKNVFLLAALYITAMSSISVYATQPESIAVDNDLVQQYAEDLQKLNESQEALSESEIESQEAGNAENGDASEEVLYGGVKPGTNTGYVNIILGPPDYIHETGYLHVIDINSGEMYGCKNYEANGYYGQICLPAGIYMIADGGLISDTTGRFFVEPVQFQVKAGSQKDMVVKVYDSQPEREEEAYPEISEETIEESTSNAEPETLDPEAQEEIAHGIMPVIVMVLISVLGGAAALFLGWKLVTHDKSPGKGKFRGFDE